MSSAIDVSVIIPAYNRGALLRETLASVWAQTRQPSEVIVVDDGSAEDIQGCLGKMRDSAHFLRVPHGGQGAARNAGLAVAQGDTIAFLDSDDLWEPDFLEKMATALRAAPGAGFAYCDYATFDRNGVLQAACLRPEEKIGGNVFARMIHGAFVCVGSLLIRRECFRRTGAFEPGLVPAEDWDLWLRLSLFYPAVYVDAPLLKVRFHPGNSSRGIAVMYAQNLRILARFERRYPAVARQYRGVIRAHLRFYHSTLARHYWKAVRPLPAVRHTGLWVRTSLP